MDRVTDYQAAHYAEFSPAGIESIAAEALRLGFTIVGKKADDAHTYGAHLSKARLLGTGHTRDYTLTPPPSTRNDRACAAIDLGMGPEWSGEWLDDLRVRCRTGAIGFIGELIGDPDLILGPGTDVKEALYASAGTEWIWTRYMGTGHVAWCHIWVKRDRLADVGLGPRVFEGWGTAGRDDVVNRAQVEAIVRDMDFPIKNHTYKKLDQILNALSGLADRVAGEGRKQLIKETRDAVLAELKSTSPGED